MLIYSIITTVIIATCFTCYLFQNNKSKKAKAIGIMFYDDFYNPTPDFDKNTINKFIKANTFIVTSRNENYGIITNERAFLKDFKSILKKNANIQYYFLNDQISFVLSFDCSEDIIVENLKNIAMLYPNIYFGISQCIKKDLIDKAIEKNLTPDNNKYISRKFFTNSEKALKMGLFNKQQVYRFDVGEARTFSKFTTETAAKLWSAFNSKNTEQLLEVIRDSYKNSEDYAQCMYISNNLLHFLHTVLGKNNITVDEVYGNNVNLYRWIVYTTKKDILVTYMENWYKKAVVYIDEHTEKVNDIEIKIEKYIAENYNKDISITTMAEEFKVSSQYFSRYFKSQTGSNFLETLNKYRIKKALVLLNDTDLPMTEIASMTGFNNYKSFARNFKKYTGKIPSEYGKK